MTKAQWLTKIKTFVPTWFWQTEQHQQAIFDGIAEVISTADEDSKEHVKQLYIMQSSGEYLDSHGEERTLQRTSSEFDAQFAVRVQTIKNKSNIPAIKTAVDQMLINGQCTIAEDYNSSLYFGDAYCNRGDLFLAPIHNTFSIIVDNQRPDPNAFFSRSYFYDREDYMGTLESSSYVFNLIVEFVNKAKAFGVFYRLIERTE